MNKNTIRQIIYISLISLFLIACLITMALCELAKDPHNGIVYIFGDHPPVFVFMDLSFLLFSISGFVISIISLLLKKATLMKMSYHISLIGYGTGIPAAIFMHGHYNYGQTDPYYVSIIFLVFNSLSLLLVLAMMAFCLVQRFLLNKKALIATAVREAKEDDGIEMLKKYKKLLDDGVISQEDYDKKKKEILEKN